MRLSLTSFTRWATPLAVVVAVAVAANSACAQETWDGGGADTNWTTDLNWADDTAPAVGLQPTVDIVFGANSSSVGSSVVFNRGTSQYKTVSLNGNGWVIAPNSGALQVLNGFFSDAGTGGVNEIGTPAGVDTGAIAYNSVSGTLKISGAGLGYGMSTSNFFTFQGAGDILHTGSIGNYGVATVAGVRKLGTGTMTLSGDNTQYKGCITVGGTGANDGKLIVTDAKALGVAAGSASYTWVYRNAIVEIQNLGSSDEQFVVGGGATSLMSAVLVNGAGNNTLTRVTSGGNGMKVSNTAVGTTLTISNGITNLGGNTAGMAFDGAGDITVDGNIVIPNVVTKSGAGVLTINGNLTAAALGLGYGAKAVVNGNVSGKAGPSLDTSLSAEGATKMTAEGTYSGKIKTQGEFNVGAGTDGIGLVTTLTNFELASSGKLVFQLAGTNRGVSYDSITCATFTMSEAGTPATVGDIKVEFANGFTAENEDVFQLINWTTANGGTFAAAFDVDKDLLLPTLTGDLTWDTTEFTTSGTISVVPEPSTIAACLMIGLALVGYRVTRRRKS